MDPEELTDSVLRSYTGVEPRAGWERRILSRTRGPRVTPWLALLPVLATAIVAIIWIHPPTLVQYHRQEIVKAVPPSVPVIRIQRSTVWHVRRPMPKERIFPTPTPLTSDERALLSLAAESSQASDVLRVVDPGPIQIAPIQIPALEKEN